MRFYEKEPLHAGETRTITKFLWYPVKIERETRWLETAKIIQEVIDNDDGANVWTSTGWANI